MAKFCPYCGASVTEGGKFCSSCGAKLEESSPSESKISLDKQESTSTEQNNSVPNPAPTQNDFFVDDNGIEEMFLKRTGRLNRLRFIQRTLALGFAELIVILILVALFSNEYHIISKFGNVAITLVSIAALYPDYCLMTRRLYDLNKNDILAKVSVGLYLVYIMYSFQKDPFADFGPSDVELIILLVQFAFTIYLFCAQGVKGRNQYGPDPLG